MAVLKSTLPYPPLHTGSDVVILSDWDGTITALDSNDYLTDNFGCGIERRRELNVEILAGTNTFRDAFREELESVQKSFEECKEILKENIKIDPSFKEFFAWCKEHKIPFIIVSSGMEPLIRAILSSLVGEKDANSIDIISNAVEFDEAGRWHISYRHPESGFGHDKSQAILPYRDLANPPTLFFFGDGVSDLSAAKHADVLFVKNINPGGQSDLSTYCVREGIKHLMFNDFSDALPIVAGVVEGKMTVEEALKGSPI